MPLIVYSHESVPVGVDTTPLLETGQTPSGATVAVVRLDTGEVPTDVLSGTPEILDKIITQVVHNLRPGGRYRVLVDFDADQNTRRSAPIEIFCPF